MDRFEKEVRSHKRRRLMRNVLIALVVLCVPPGIVAYNLGQRGSVRQFMSAMSEVWASPDLVFRNSDRVNVVFIGVDVNRDRRGMPYTKNSRSDTILVVSFDRVGKTISAVSIPRDTVVMVPGHYTTKINAAHALGGPELLLETLRESLGIQANYYVKVKFAGLEKAVDAVGGVDLEVEKDMDYDDKWGQLHIHLKKGYQHLDGAKAHQYVRFRHDALGDIGRVARQQKLMKALARKMLSPAMVTRIPRLLEVFQEFVETNMTSAELMSLGAFARTIDADTITTETLPGSPRGGYWAVDRESAPVVLARILGSTFSPRVLGERYVAAPTQRGPVRRHEATEPPLEPTAIIPQAVPVDESNLTTPQPAEPVIIDSTESAPGSPPEATGGGRGEQTSETGISRPGVTPEAKTGNSGVSTPPDASKSKESGQGATGSRQEPPSLAPERSNPPSSSSSGNP